MNEIYIVTSVTEKENRTHYVGLDTKYAIEIFDFDRDGSKDIVLGGNLYRVKPEAGRYDASYGLFLKGDGAGNFSAVQGRDSGLVIDGEVRDFAVLKTEGKDALAVIRNNDSVLFFSIH